MLSIKDLNKIEKFVNGYGHVVYYKKEQSWYTANDCLASDDSILEKWNSNVIFPICSVNYESVDHPNHYGGESNPYEAIKVIEAWGLCFHLGNVAKYICRNGKKDDEIQELKKARWYLDRKIEILENAKRDL